MAPAPELPKNSVHVVEQAAALLYALAQDPPERGVRDLARDLGMTKSTVQRILVALENTGLLAFNRRSRRYSLGVGLIKIAAPFLQNTDIVQAARAPMVRLRRLSGESVLLSVAVGSSRITLHQLESPHELRFATSLGRPYPLHIGGTGRVLLASMPVEERERLLAAMFRPDQPEGDGESLDRSVRPRISEDALRASIAEVAERGHAETFGEWVPGGAGLAVPIQWTNDGLVAALSLYGPETRLTRARMHELLPEVKGAASETSLRVSTANGEP